MTLQHTPQEVALLNFWYDFDNIFAHAPPPDVQRDINIVIPYYRLLPVYSKYRRDRKQLQTEFQGDVDAFSNLANHQLRLLRDHFQGVKAMEILAFTSFAQGILFDDLPRPPDWPKRDGDESIHMMNSDIASYLAWHAFIMVLLLIDDKADKRRWLEIDKYLVLAAAILEKLKSLNRQPIRHSVPNMNKALDDSTLKTLENYWLQENIGFEQLDDAMAQFARI